MIPEETNINFSFFPLYTRAIPKVGEKISATVTSRQSKVSKKNRPASD